MRSLRVLFYFSVLGVNLASAITIDKIAIHSFETAYSAPNSNYVHLLLGSDHSFVMSNGTTQPEGAGGTGVAGATFLNAQVNNGKISYTFSNLVGTWFSNFNTFSNVLLAYGDWGINSEAVITFPGAPVITADLGAKHAYWTGYAYIAANSPTQGNNIGFTYLSAPVGTWVPFSADIYNIDGVFNATTFTSPYRFEITGSIQFAPVAGSVPDTGATMSMFGFALLGLIGLFRRLRFVA